MIVASDAKGKNPEAAQVWRARGGTRSRSRSPFPRRPSRSRSRGKRRRDDSIRREMRKLKELLGRRRSRSYSRSPSPDGMRRGEVLRINADRGFGFIGDDRDEYFFHTNTLERELDIL